jgi:hypothetical protein
MHCNAFRSEHRSSTCRRSTTVRRLSPGAPESADHASGVRDIRRFERNFQPGRDEVPRVLCSTRPGANLVEGGHRARSSRGRTRGGQERPVVRPCLRPPVGGGPRFEAAHQPPVRRVDRTKLTPIRRLLGVSSMTRHRALDPPQGDDASEVSASSRREERVCSANIRIPGPDASGRRGVDTNASTSAAPCARMSTGASSLCHHRRTDGLPPLRCRGDHACASSRMRYGARRSVRPVAAPRSSTRKHCRGFCCNSVAGFAAFLTRHAAGAGRLNQAGCRFEDNQPSPPRRVRR